MHIIRGIGGRKSALMALCMVMILAAGCYQPASIEPQQPTIGSDRVQPTHTIEALPATPTAPSQTQPPPGQPTLLPIAASATAMKATLEAGGVDLPTQEPSAGATQPAPDAQSEPPGPGQSEMTPTSVDDSPLVTPTQLPIGAAAEGCVHAIQPGETLFSLARQWNTTVDEIAILNEISNPNSVAAGTELKVPNCEAGETVGGAQPTQASSGGGQVYVVQPGDTVFGIARRFGVTPQDIIDANPALQANPDQLSVGQELIIP